eukprot:229971-Rhodomonas_salina.1
MAGAAQVSSIHDDGAGGAQADARARHDPSLAASGRKGSDSLPIRKPSAQAWGFALFFPLRTPWP